LFESRDGNAQTHPCGQAQQGSWNKKEPVESQRPNEKEDRGYCEINDGRQARWPGQSAGAKDSGSEGTHEPKRRKLHAPFCRCTKASI
jgi:hypothetical protein